MGLQVPLSVLVAWIMGVQMDLDFKLLETGSLFMAVLVTAFTLQVHCDSCIFTLNRWKWNLVTENYSDNRITS